MSNTELVIFMLASGDRILMDEYQSVMSYISIDKANRISEELLGEGYSSDGHVVHVEHIKDKYKILLKMYNGDLRKLLDCVLKSV